MFRRKDSLNYSLGSAAYGLGLGMMKNLSISEVALPHMRVLVDEIRLAGAPGRSGWRSGRVHPESGCARTDQDRYLRRPANGPSLHRGWQDYSAYGPEDLLEQTLAKQTYIRHTQQYDYLPGS